MLATWAQANAGTHTSIAATNALLTCTIRILHAAGGPRQPSPSPAAMPNAMSNRARPLAKRADSSDSAKGAIYPGSGMSVQKRDLTNI
jgi:hypothetical protein